jgi:thiol:disulfide interchange protein DsbD
VSSGLEITLRDHPLAALPLLFGAGLLTSLTPCVYPMIPITAGLLGGTAAGGSSRWRSGVLTLAYVSGLALVYSSLGLLAGMTGTLFGTVSSNPWASFAMGNLLLLFGLGLLDVYTMRAPAPLLTWASRITAASPGGAFAMGATSGLVAAPCGAPAFGAVLTFVAATRSAGLGFLYLLVFSLGMSVLLVAVGLSTSLLARLPAGGRWTLRLKQACGLILIGTAEYYFVRMGKVL